MQYLSKKSSTRYCVLPRDGWYIEIFVNRTNIHLIHYLIEMFSLERRCDIFSMNTHSKTQQNLFSIIGRILTGARKKKSFSTLWLSPVNKRMLGVFSWHNPLSSFYVVHVNEWLSITNDIGNISFIRTDVFFRIIHCLRSLIHDSNIRMTRP